MLMEGKWSSRSLERGREALVSDFPTLPQRDSKLWKGVAAGMRGPLRGLLSVDA